MHVRSGIAPSSELWAMYGINQDGLSGMPPSSAVVICKFVAATPGAATRAFTLEPFALRRSASSDVNTQLASFVCPYLVQRAPVYHLSPPSSPPFFCRYSGKRRSVDFRARLEWETTRASPRSSAARSSRTKSSLVRRKWLRWLVCICTSYPSTVAISFSAITPALSASTSIPSLHVLCISVHARLTEAKSARSQSIACTLPSLPSLDVASAARCDGLLSVMTRAPRDA
mmetsp:Transcript_1433/g.3430  ORF Transcript_1433/g.3430 Transcript_1433/m.3430 type:complete len:229 (-) Transcript_1433:173-859(-)